MLRFTRRALLASAVLCSQSALVTLCRAQINPAEESRARQILHDRNFWLNDGRDFSHMYNPTTAADIVKIAKDPLSDPATRLRAQKLALDLAGNSRHAKSLAVDAARFAVSAAMSHIEKNLGEPHVARFGPEQGLTHLTVSRDGPLIWVLIESVDRHGGLNISIDPTQWTVVNVNPWGEKAKPANPPPA